MLGLCQAPFRPLTQILLFGVENASFSSRNVARAGLFCGVLPFGNEPLRSHPIASEPNGNSPRDGAPATLRRWATGGEIRRDDREGPRVVAAAGRRPGSDRECTASSRAAPMRLPLRAGPW